MGGASMNGLRFARAAAMIALIAMIAVVGLGAGAAKAQPAAQPVTQAPSGMPAAPAAKETRPRTGSVQSLLAAGFEIRAVTPLGLEAARRINAEIESEALLVTLQRGPALAVCFVSVPGWAFLREAAVNVPQNCDLRDFAAP